MRGGPIKRGACGTLARRIAACGQHFGMAPAFAQFGQQAFGLQGGSVGGAHPLTALAQLDESLIIASASARLPQGLATLIEHPGRIRLWWVHLGWAAWAMLFVTGFWWAEFELSRVADWTVIKFLFLLLYSSLYFLVCTILFPVGPPDEAGFQHYFISQRYWFFGFIAGIALLDIGDTLLKGAAHLAALGAGYVIYIAGLIAIAAAGVICRSARGHALILMLALLLQIAWLIHGYYRLV